MTEIETKYVNPQAQTETEVNNNWWLVPDEQIHQHVLSVVNGICERQSYRRTLNIRYARMYSNLELLGFTHTSSVGRSSTDLVKNRVTYNIVQSVIDTAHSKIAKMKPKPMFLTEGGDFTQQQRAKKLTKYMEGVFYDSDLYAESKRVFLDGGVFGTGALKIYSNGYKICVERVIPDEIFVDDYDGIYGKPRQLHQVTYVDRSRLIELYPDFKNQIKAAQSKSDSSYDTQTSDLIQIIESWHLPSSEDSKDGKHVITISGATLFSEGWDKDYFPFVFFRWCERLSGFYGQGIAEQLTGIQIEINRLLRNIQKAQSLVAIPRVILDSNSKVSTSTLNNEVGSILKVSSGGRDPKFFTPTAMNPEVYNHLKWLIQSGYEQTGVSQLSATSRKPGGITSGVALREYNDIETERFALVSQRFEQFHLDAARIIIDMSRDLYKDNKSLSVKIKGKDFIETIKWSEVDLPNEKFDMKVWPVSLLPSTPAGKLQKVQELIQAGFIDKETAMSLLDFPDLEGYESLSTANSQIVKKQLEQMLQDNKYSPPEPAMDLDYAFKITQLAYLKAKIENVPEENLELLLRYMDDIDRLKNLNTPTQAVQPQPTANPEPTPTTDLLPNNPVV